MTRSRTLYCCTQKVYCSKRWDGRLKRKRYGRKFPCYPIVASPIILFEWPGRVPERTGMKLSTQSVLTCFERVNFGGCKMRIPRLLKGSIQALFTVVLVINCLEQEAQSNGLKIDLSNFSPSATS